MASTTWRPTADSFRNLAVFWAALGVGATVTATTVTAPSVLVALLAVAVAGGLAVAATVSRVRLTRALASAGRPKLSNWPPRPDQREQAVRAGWANARRAGAMAFAFGALLGLAPVLGPGVAAAGWAGLVGSFLAWRTVHRYERDSDVVVVTARPDRRKRTPLELGLLPRPQAES